jgi:thioredoxin 1
MMAGAVLEVTEQTFGEQVEKASEVVLVDFWAPWCGPCRALAPVLDELARDFEGKAKVCKVNTDENLELAKKFRVSSIPSLIVFKDGQPVEQVVGVQQKSNLASLLEKHSAN